MEINNKHDYFNSDCKENKPEKLATNSKGVTFYRCKNCNCFGDIECFTSDFIFMRPSDKDINKLEYLMM